VPDVLLTTFSAMPDGEPGHAALDLELARRGITSRWVRWDDAEVDWAGAGVVAARSTWDYEDRLTEFLAWAEAVEAAGPVLLNGSAVFRWNTDKRYLVELAGRGVPVVPSVLVHDREDVRPLVARFGRAVVKPRVAAGGRGLLVVDDAEAWAPTPPGGPWLGQPVVESVHSEGEHSVFVLNGRAVSQVRKVAAVGDVRVHEEYGGSSMIADLDPVAAEVAVATTRAVEELLGTELSYGRVDLMRYDGRLVVSEVEITEPGLYLDVIPGNAVPFADAVQARL
jgi:glutathione synthase/RimK-type ligase-like ATP-grasp enzyme